MGQSRNGWDAVRTRRHFLDVTDKESKSNQEEALDKPEQEHSTKLTDHLESSKLSRL